MVAWLRFYAEMSRFFPDSELLATLAIKLRILTILFH